MKLSNIISYNEIYVLTFKKIILTYHTIFIGRDLATTPFVSFKN